MNNSVVISHVNNFWILPNHINFNKLNVLINNTINDCIKNENVTPLNKHFKQNSLDLINRIERLKEHIVVIELSFNSHHGISVSDILVKNSFDDAYYKLYDEVGELTSEGDDYGLDSLLIDFKNASQIPKTEEYKHIDVKELLEDLTQGYIIDLHRTLFKCNMNNDKDYILCVFNETIIDTEIIYKTIISSILWVHEIINDEQYENLIENL